MPRFRELHNICYEGLHAKKYPYRKDNQLLEIATVNGSKRQALLNNRITDWVGRMIPNDKVRTPLEDLPLQTSFPACQTSFFSGTFPSTWRGALGVKTRPGQQNMRVDIVWSHIIATCRETNWAVRSCSEHTGHRYDERSALRETQLYFISRRSIDSIFIFLFSAREMKARHKQT